VCLSFLPGERGPEVAGEYDGAPLYVYDGVPDVFFVRYALRKKKELSIEHGRRDYRATDCGKYPTHKESKKIGTSVLRAAENSEVNQRGIASACGRIGQMYTQI
jgi:hypothetical protein